MEYQRSFVLEWLNSGAHFDQGVVLYARIGKNRNMAALFPGRKQRYESKLRYELCKSVGIDWRKEAISTFSAASSACDVGLDCVDIADSLVVGDPVPSVGSVSITDPDFNSSSDSQSYPAVVRRVIHEYGEAYRERSRLHYQMTSVVEGNSPENMAIRRELLVGIKALSARMDVLFAAKDNYLRSRVLPDAGALWPPEKPAAPLVEAAPLPDDPVELRKLKKNLQTYNVKDNNLLQYQSVSSQPEKHPMPQGPRRLGIEKRIRSRMKMIERIDYKLVEHAL
jgi:hypothetical protein